MAWFPSALDTEDLNSISARLADKLGPYFRSFCEGARHCPDTDLSAEMSSPEEIAQWHTQQEEPGLEVDRPRLMEHSDARFRAPEAEYSEGGGDPSPVPDGDESPEQSRGDLDERFTSSRDDTFPTLEGVVADPGQFFDYVYTLPLRQMICGYPAYAELRIGGSTSLSSRDQPRMLRQEFRPPPVRHERTGASWATISRPARQLPPTMPPHSGNLWFIAGHGASERLSRLVDPRMALRKRAGPEYVTIQDSRHTFATHTCR